MLDSLANNYRQKIYEYLQIYSEQQINLQDEGNLDDMINGIAEKTSDQWEMIYFEVCKRIPRPETPNVWKRIDWYNQVVEMTNDLARAQMIEEVLLVIAPEPYCLLRTL